MQTIVLVQRFKGRLTDVGPGLIDVSLTLAGEQLGDGLPVPGADGVREVHGVAVFVVDQEES